MLQKIYAGYDMHILITEGFAHSAVNAASRTLTGHYSTSMGRTFHIGCSRLISLLP